MVYKVYGKIDGVSAIFTQDKSGVWVSDTPKNPTAYYVIEVWAEDGAGNIGYRNAMLYFWDSRCFKWVALPLTYTEGAVVKRKFFTMPLNRSYNILSYEKYVATGFKKYSEETLCRHYD